MIIKNKYQLQRYIHYNQYTGVFTRIQKSSTGPSSLGTVKMSGHKSSSGEIKIMGEWYRLAHLAWLYMTSAWPAGYVTHKDGDIHNYAWSNLREGAAEDGYAVTWIEKRQRFQVYTNKNPRTYVGCFRDIESVKEALDARREL